MTTQRVQISEGLSEFSTLEEFKLQKYLLSESHSHKIKVQKAALKDFSPFDILTKPAMGVGSLLIFFTNPGFIAFSNLLQERSICEW